MEADVIDSEEAVAALAAIDDSKARLAVATVCPPWRHWAFGGLLGVLGAARGFAPTLGMALNMLVIVAVALLVRSDRRRTGLFINGYRAGATRPITLALVLLTIGAQFVGAYATSELAMPWLAWALGAALVPVGFLFSQHWQTVYQRELRGQR
jgi:hypothetical protein